MNNQQDLWNKAHDKGEIAHYSQKPTTFAEEVLEILKPHSKILELGCGVGNDSVSFAQAGHTVLATDFSDVAIQKNKERFQDVENLTFQTLDIEKPMEYDDNEFDAVYARLSLHYFPDNKTRNIFQELHRILVPNGLLCFICKSTTDPLYGKGREIEPDMYDLDGHIRHFFSENYAKELLKDTFEIETLESGTDKFYDSESAFIKVIAKNFK